MNSLIKDLSMRPEKAAQPETPTETPTETPIVAERRESLIKEFTNVQAALKSSDKTDAGKSDVVDRATAASDVGFNLMRNTINSSGQVTGSDVADYIERAEELNDEVDTVPFGLETDDGQIVKVYVNAEQADAFEEAMKNMLGLEDDIEEAISRLTTEFDIVDVVWPKSEEDVDGDGDPDQDLTIDDTTNLEDPEDDADFADDQYDVIAGGETPPEADSSGKPKAAAAEDEPEEGEPAPDEEEDTEKKKSSDTEGDEEPEEEEEDSDGDGTPDDEDEDPDDPDKSGKKKKKKKKSEPAEPAEGGGGKVKESQDPRDDEADSPSTAKAIKLMTSKGLHIAAMKEVAGNTVYIEDSQGDEYVLRGDSKLTKEKHGKKLMSLQKEDYTQEKSMTIGSKFLSRVLAEAAPAEDRDGVKDGFNIPLDAQARAMAAKLKLPFAKRLIAFHYMCGVPGRYMNTSDVTEAVAGAADMLRKKVAVRRAFTTFYEGLAAAKGFTIPTEEGGQAPVKEAKIDEASKTKRGGFIQKLLESVLTGLGLPETLITTTGPSAVGTGIFRTAELIEQDSTLERSLRLLATRMGIRGQDAQAQVQEAKAPKKPKDNGQPIEVKGVKGMKSTPWSKKFKNQEAMEKWMDLHGDGITVHAYSADRVNEDLDEDLDEAVDVGNDDYAQAVTALVDALGIPADILERRRTQVVQALRKKKATIRNRAQVLTMIGRVMDILQKNTVEPNAAQQPKEPANESAARWKHLSALQEAPAAEDSDEQSAKKVYARIKNEKNLSAKRVRELTKQHDDLLGNSSASTIAALVIDMLDEKGLLAEAAKDFTSSEGWVTHKMSSKSKSPVSDDKVVMIRRRDHTTATGPASRFYWGYDQPNVKMSSNYDTDKDVIAYKVKEK